MRKLSKDKPVKNNPSRSLVKLALGFSLFCVKIAVALVILIEAQELHGKVIRHMVEDKISYMIVPVGVEGAVMGTGFNINLPSGNVALLTNRHICSASKDGFVLVRKEGSMFMHRKKIKKMAEDTDLCLVESIPGESGLSLAGSVEISDKVISVGHPAGLPLMPSYGEAVGLVVENVASMYVEGECKWANSKVIDGGGRYGVFGKICIETQQALLTTCQVVGGSSGSPLFNIFGNVVGVIYASGQNNWAYAVPLAHIKQFLKNE